MNNKNKIVEFLKNNYGYIRTSDFLKMNIPKPSIQKYIDAGLIERVSHGLYMNSNQFPDDYYILQKRYPHIVFSHNTALYILNLTNRTPTEIDITILSGKTIKGSYNKYYISAKKFNVGIMTTTSPFGNPIKIYNAERCICDILKTDGLMELELQNRVLNEYFKSKDKNIERLLEYAKIFNIYDKVKSIMGVMMKW